MPFEISGLLVAALCAPVAGALLYPALNTSAKAAKAFDRFMYVGVPILVLYHIFGHGWTLELVVAILLVLGGLGLPLAVERTSDFLAAKTDSMALAIGISGLAVHVIIESAVLSTDSTDLALALVLHRIAVGLMVYWLVRLSFGSLLAWTAVAAILVATVLGYTVIGAAIVEYETAEYYQFFVSGSLLHVVFHRGFSARRHDHSGS